MRLLLLILVLFAEILYSQTSQWLPLNVGNQWQYTNFARVQAFGDTYFYYRTQNDGVLKDTIIDGKQYFKYHFGDKSSWLRYSDDDKIYIYKNGEGLFMDFNLETDSLFDQLFFDGKVFPAHVITDSITFYDGTKVFSKGFARDYYSDNFIVKFVKGFGLAYSLEHWIYPHDAGFYELSPIMSLLKDSLTGDLSFTQHNKPAISLQPVTVTSNKNFSIQFNVTHYYDRPGFYFADSVYVNYYYSINDSAMTDLQKTIIPVGDSCKIDFYLDTAIMKKGGVLKYNFTALDKGIIREISSAPESGFYSCKWEEPAVVNDKDILYSFKLSPNYPNPFNPSTTIKYSLPYESTVKIVIYNSIGQVVSQIVNELKSPGNYEVLFNGSGISSGIYFYSINAFSTYGKQIYSDTKKMLLLK